MPSSRASQPQSRKSSESAAASQGSQEALERQDVAFEDWIELILNALPKLFDEIGFSCEDIQYLADGVYNVVFSFKRLQASLSEDLVIRIVQLADEHSEKTFENHIALLKHLRSTGLLVPEVLHYDPTGDNILGRAYSIQTRIQGRPLEDIWRGLPVADKCDLMDQIARQISSHEQVRFGRMGDLGEIGLHELIDGTSRRAQKIHPTNLHHRITVPCGPQPLDEFFQALFDIRITEEKKDSNRGRIKRRCKNMKRVIGEMKNKGYFEGYTTTGNVVLSHNDLHFHNILVRQEDERWVVSGILDWDEAITRPRVLTRKPLIYTYTESPWEDEARFPFWNRNEDFISEKALMENLTPEELALKEAFDVAMARHLPDFMEETYGRGRLVRQVGYYALQGFDLGPWNHKVSERVLADWATLQGQHFRKFILVRRAYIDEWVDWFQWELPLSMGWHGRSWRYLLKEWVKTCAGRFRCCGRNKGQEQSEVVT